MRAWSIVRLTRFWLHDWLAGHGFSFLCVRADAHAVADALRVDCGAPSPVKVEPMWNGQSS